MFWEFRYADYIFKKTANLTLISAQDTDGMHDMLDMHRIYRSGAGWESAFPLKFVLEKLPQAAELLLEEINCLVLLIFFVLSVGMLFQSWLMANTLCLSIITDIHLCAGFQHTNSKLTIKCKMRTEGLEDLMLLYWCVCVCVAHIWPYGGWETTLGFVSQGLSLYFSWN